MGFGLHVGGGPGGPLVLLLCGVTTGVESELVNTLRLSFLIGLGAAVLPAGSSGLGVCRLLRAQRSAQGAGSCHPVLTDGAPRAPF